MNIRAIDSYEHLEPGEPIPEIELRYNEHTRVGYRAFTRVALWALGAIFLAQIVLHLALDSQWLKLILSMVFTFGIIAWVIRDAVKQQRLAGTTPEKDDAWGLSLREQVRYMLFYGLVMWGVMGGFRVASDGWMGLVTTGVFYLLMLGLILVVMGRFSREPGQLCCIKCDYPLTGLTLPCDCPECGAAVRDLWFVTDRPRARDGRLVLIGAVLTLFSISAIVLQFYRPQALYNAMPREALLRLAPTDRDAFDALMTTTVTPEEQEKLLAAMIANRVGFDPGASYEQSSWLAAMIEQGHLSTEELDRLFAEFATCSIEAPDQARVGEPNLLTLSAAYARAPTRPYYCFSGFEIDGETIRDANAARMYSRTFIVNGAQQEYIDKGYVPAHIWTPTEPGVHTIRARVVFAMGTGYRSNATVTWSDENMPEFPATPMWYRVVDLEHTIEVVE